MSSTEPSQSSEMRVRARRKVGHVAEGAQVLGDGFNQDEYPALRAICRAGDQREAVR